MCGTATSNRPLASQGVAAYCLDKILTAEPSLMCSAGLWRGSSDHRISTKSSPKPMITSAARSASIKRQETASSSHGMKRSWRTSTSGPRYGDRRPSQAIRTNSRRAKADPERVVRFQRPRWARGAPADQRRAKPKPASSMRPPAPGPRGRSPSPQQGDPKTGRAAPAPASRGRSPDSRWPRPRTLVGAVRARTRPPTPSRTCGEPLRNAAPERRSGPRHRRAVNNKIDPLDELVFIILSQMTTGPSYERVYDRLKAAMPHWRSLTETSVADLTSLIADAGFAGQRAVRLRQIADRLVDDFGEVSLTALSYSDDDAAQQYLTSLPGVGVKTAKCVMMYSLGRRVLPVDTHTARVAVRLGLVATGSAASLDRDLSVVIPPPLCFDFHVNAIAHGRAVCRAVRPRCDDCVLSSLCPAARTTNRSSRRRSVRPSPSRPVQPPGCRIDDGSSQRLQSKP